MKKLFTAVARPENAGARACHRHGPPDQNNASLRVADQPDPAQDKGTHDDLADISLTRRQMTEIETLDPHNMGGALGPAENQELAVVEQIHSAGELARAMDGEDVGSAFLIGVEDFDRAFEHENEVDAALAALEYEHIVGDQVLIPVLGNSAHLLRAPPRNGLTPRALRSVGSKSGAILPKVQGHDASTVSDIV